MSIASDGTINGTAAGGGGGGGGVASSSLLMIYNGCQIVNLLMIAPSVGLFICVTAAIFSSEKLCEKSRYVLFANLLACDTAFLLFTTTISTMIWLQVGLSVASCNANTMASTALNDSGAVCVTLMAVERYAAICHPLRHPRWFSRRNTLACLAAVWSFSCLVPLAPGVIVFASGMTQNATRTCSTLITDKLLPDPAAITTLRELPNALIFTLSFGVLVFTYWRIVAAAKRASGRSSRAQRAQRTVIIHAVQLFLYLCTLGNTLFTMIFEKITSDVRVISILRMVNYLLLYYTSRFVVPLIYGFRDKNLRQNLKKLFKRAYNKVTTF